MPHSIQTTQKNSPFTGYVQLSPLKANNFAKGMTYTPSIMVGGGIEDKHFKMMLEAGYSTNNVLDVNFEAGPKFKLNKDWTLTTGLKMAYAGEVGDNKNAVAITNSNLKEEFTETLGWNEQSLRGGLKAEANYSTENLNIGVGLEGGYYSKGPEIAMYYDSSVFDGKDSASQSTIFKRDGKNGVYITPTVSADYQLGKGVSLNLKANAFEGNAGIRYTF